MKKFYHSTTFDFSEKARDWILYKYRDSLRGDVGHNTDLTQYSPQAQAEWHNSIVCKEVNAFLKNYGADTSYYGMNVFLCTNGNPDPHIDTKLDVEGNVYRIKSRFNIMVLGTASDPLTWWGDFDLDHPNVVDTKFIAPNGKEYTNKSVPGDSTQARWDYLGEPSCVAKNVYTPSAFVKTDCAHTVDCTPGMRLLVTVALDKTIEDLLAYKGTQ